MRISLDKNPENKLMFVIVGIVSLFIAVFFTSKMWLNDDSPIQQTKFNEVIKMEQTELLLSKWTYNKKDNFMEIVLEKNHTGADIIKPTFEFLSKEDEENIEIETEVVYESESMAVIELRNIPEEFRYIKVAVDEYRDEETVRSESNDDEVEKEIKPKRIVLVGDYRVIEVDNNIKTRKKEDYEKENIVIEIQSLEDEIASIKGQKIPLKEKSIKQILKDIEQIEEDKNFATDEEVYELEREIYSKENSIEAEEKAIDELDEKVENLKNKIESLQTKIDYLDGKPVEKKEREDEDEENIEGESVTNDSEKVEENKPNN